MSNLHASLATSIIKHQESIIGPLSWSEAGKVSGLNVKDHKVRITGDGKKVLEDLVQQYAQLFGQASVEACKEAVHTNLPKHDLDSLPSILL